MSLPIKLKWSILHSNIISQFFCSLEKSSIRYFILRNYEGLPRNNSSKDIDIIIEPKSYKKASDILLSIFIENKIEYMHIVKYERVHCLFGISKSKCFSIHIDLIEGYLSKGFEMFPFDFLYANTEKYNTLTVLNAPLDAIMLLYYKVIGTKELKRRYRDKIALIYHNHSVEIDKIINKTLNKECSSLVIESLSNNNFEEIIKNSKLMSVTSKKRIFLQKPISTTINICSFLLEKFYKIIICPRRFQNFFAVQGADGTGKSTFIDGLCKELAFYYVSDESKLHIYHHRPSLFPNLGAMGEKVGAMKEDKDFTNPHRAKPSGFIGSFIRMTYYWLDYWIGAPLLLRKDVQFDKFTIYDRYIYDFLIDPKRSRINLPYTLRKIFTRTVVQPRIVFVLLADAETIYKRKQELTIEEINRQLGELSKLAKSNKRFVIIDANKTPQEMVDDAMTTILNKFTKRLC